MESCKSKKYIHYGHKKFERVIFCPIRNRECFTKPSGGLWASPVGAENGWKDWCEAENFRECNDDNSFVFAISESANVLHIRDIKDLDRLPQVKSTYQMWCQLDFEKLLENGIDAIELHLSEEDLRGLAVCEGLYWSLYGWDCDSILIMNPDVIMCGGE